MDKPIEKFTARNVSHRLSLQRAVSEQILIGPGLDVRGLEMTRPPVSKLSHFESPSATSYKTRYAPGWSQTSGKYRAPGVTRSTSLLPEPWGPSGLRSCMKDPNTSKYNISESIRGKNFFKKRAVLKKASRLSTRRAVTC